MLLLAVPSIWPYGYYQVLRWVVSLTGVINAHRAYKENLVGWSVIMIILAIIFNPISAVTFAKGTWVIIDVIAAILFLILSAKFRTN
ncbi:MAG: hypothetical protein A2571_00315 [Candidatus Vogelbacteria bacterium RIFOXYD1_FULL_44_32]|uniref:Uncharacterized protein n=1 Tax=Candidatus Vogelbacteria bacterium RIFOXYD1_FULL_44_32 TaxID=1802438 RepID=A0A1G2QG93_9BACT|nr:MAG: hypothetical protein A2571_00315 [Candidatus Vogelbacteria bacterium RIFOXYD1_FULL_44_32]